MSFAVAPIEGGLVPTLMRADHGRYLAAIRFPHHHGSALSCAIPIQRAMARKTGRSRRRSHRGRDGLHRAQGRRRRSPAARIDARGASGRARTFRERRSPDHRRVRDRSGRSVGQEDKVCSGPKSAATDHGVVSHLPERPPPTAFLGGDRPTNEPGRQWPRLGYFPPAGRAPPLHREAK